MLAIGSPFELSQTVTAGIVSATGRANVGFTDYEDFIQTDAAINPGNSGGALINTRGELVGINTGIFSQSGGYQGIGFAVPEHAGAAHRQGSDAARRGAARHDQRDLASSRSRRTSPSSSAPRAPAARSSCAIYRDTDAFDAGLRRGDIIVGFNGQAIDDPSQLFRVVADATIGSHRVAQGDPGRS